MVLEHSPWQKSQAQSGTALDLSPSPVIRQKNNLAGSLEYYILTCKVEGKSPRTLYNYRRRVGELVTFAQAQGVLETEAITPYIVRLFMLSLSDRGLQPDTIAASYRAIRTFFTWLIREGIISEHPMVNMHAPRLPNKVVKPLSIPQIRDVLSLCADNSFLSTRNRAIFLIFLDTGLRLDEMACIRLAQVDIDNGIILVMGKGARERRVRLGKFTHRALLRYLMARQESNLPGLWLTEQRQPMKRNAIQIAIRRMLRRAGVSGVKIGPHTLRHTAAINYLRNGGSEFTLQVMLGHSTLEMTRHYVSSLAAEDMMKAHEKASPVDNMMK